MAAVGFGPGAQRWVHILHLCTTARVAYNGWYTDAFPARALHTFVAANRPVIGGTLAPLFYGKEASFRAAKDGGIALVHIRSQLRFFRSR
ncbi:g11262 [Coccomyxa elongata]